MCAPHRTPHAACRGYGGMRHGQRSTRERGGSRRGDGSEACLEGGDRVQSTDGGAEEVQPEDERAEDRLDHRQARRTCTRHGMCTIVKSSPQHVHTAHQGRGGHGVDARPAELAPEPMTSAHAIFGEMRPAATGRKGLLIWSISTCEIAVR